MGFEPAPIFSQQSRQQETNIQTHFSFAIMTYFGISPASLWNKYGHAILQNTHIPKHHKNPARGGDEGKEDFVPGLRPHLFKPVLYIQSVV